MTHPPTHDSTWYFSQLVILIFMLLSLSSTQFCWPDLDWITLGNSSRLDCQARNVFPFILPSVSRVFCSNALAFFFLLDWLTIYFSFGHSSFSLRCTMSLFFIGFVLSVIFLVSLFIHVRISGKLQAVEVITTEQECGRLKEIPGTKKKLKEL